MDAAGSARARRRRERLRATGLRPVQLWLPDTRDPAFIAECRRQARLIRDAETEADRALDEAWFDASDRTGWSA